MTDTKRLFSTECGSRVFDDAIRAIGDYSMIEKLNSGVVVGLSGGADSVMLLLVLVEYGRRYGEFPIVCVHVNHMIRGKEADGDEEFSRRLCEELKIPFLCEKKDVPSIALGEGLGVEEAARNVRYSCFNRVLAERGYGSVAVAHNATDNLETVILNMMRGAGTQGAAGIPPVRDKIVRPLIYSSKADILAALDNSGIPYCTDSTNLSTDYSRNYIRHGVIPMLSRLTPSPEKMATRLSVNLREDSEYILSVADEFYHKNSVADVFSSSELSKLSRAVFSRVFMRMTENFFGSCRERHLPERVHVEAVFSLLKEGKSFSYSLPGGARFVSSFGECYIEGDKPTEKRLASSKLSMGVNRLEGFSTVILVFLPENIESYSNIYKIEISAKFSSDIIAKELTVRAREDGDFYVYGGMTRRLKKLFNDKKIPIPERSALPVICDGDGILWVPGFGIRDGAKGSELVIAIAEPRDASDRAYNKLYYRFN